MAGKQKRSRRIPGFFHSRMISIISISMVLFLVGVIVALWLVGDGLKDHARESVSFTLLLDPEASNADIDKMRGELENLNFVKGVEYYSKEAALEKLSEQLGENPEEFLGWNPFRLRLRCMYRPIILLTLIV